MNRVGNPIGLSTAKYKEEKEQNQMKTTKYVHIFWQNQMKTTKCVHTLGCFQLFSAQSENLWAMRKFLSI
jgi:hypothetical protein